MLTNIFIGIGCLCTAYVAISIITGHWLDYYGNGIYRIHTLGKMPTTIKEFRIK